MKRNKYYSNANSFYYRDKIYLDDFDDDSTSDLIIDIVDVDICGQPTPTPPQPTKKPLIMVPPTPQPTRKPLTMVPPTPQPTPQPTRKPLTMVPPTPQPTPQPTKKPLIMVPPKPQPTPPNPEIISENRHHKQQFKIPNHHKHTTNVPTQQLDQKSDQQIQQIQQIQQNNNNPKVWGSKLWFSFHNGASKYPINPSPIVKNNMKNFILGIPVMLPCEKCREHANQFIESNYNNLDNIVSSRDNLFKFFVDFHNNANRKTGKPEMSYEEAKKLYNF